MEFIGKSKLSSEGLSKRPDFGIGEGSSRKPIHIGKLKRGGTAAEDVFAAALPSSVIALHEAFSGNKSCTTSSNFSSFSNNLSV